MCSHSKFFSKNVSLCVKIVIEVEIEEIESNWERTQSKSVKIRPFLMSCGNTSIRLRVKVGVDSGSPVYGVNLLWYGPTIII